MQLEPATINLGQALTTGSIARVSPQAWSPEIVENLERFSKWRVILVQGRC